VIDLDGFLKRVIFGSGVTFLSLLVIKGMTLINSIIAARLLQPADYGALSIIVNLEGLVVIVAVFGVPVAMIKHISEISQRDSNLAKSIGSALIIVIAITSAITSLIYLALSETIARDIYNNESIITAIRLSALLVLIASMNIGLASFVQGCQRIKSLARVNAAVAILAQPVTTICIWGFGLNGAILALIISNLISITMLAFVVRRVAGLSFSASKSILANKGHMKNIFAFSIPLLFSGLILILAHWIGRTVLATEWGFDSVGDFQIADNLAQMLLILSAAMSVPLLPMISEQDASMPHKVGENVKRLLCITAVAVIPLCILALPFLDSVIRLLYGVEYSTAYAAAVVMFGAASYRVICSIVSNVILGTGRVWHAFFLNLIWFFVFLTVLFMFVGDLGSKGLASAYLASFGIYVFILSIYFWRSFRVSVIRVLLLCLAFGSILVIYDEYFMSLDFSGRLIGGAVFSSAMALAGYSLVLDQFERSQIKKMARGVMRKLRIF